MEISSICLVANNSTALHLMLSLIDELEKKDQIEKYIIFCENCYWKSNKQNIVVVNMEAGEYKCKGNSLDLSKPFGKRDKKWIAQGIHAYRTLKKLFEAKKITKRIFIENDLRAVLLYSDRMFWIEQAVIALAVKKGIPRINISIGTQSMWENFESRENNLGLDVGKKWNDVNKFAYSINPKWGWKIENRTKLFYPAGECIAGYVMGMGSQNPWVNGGGRSSHVLAASIEEKNWIVSHANENCKVYVTGTLDERYVRNSIINRTAVRKMLREKYELLSDKIVILAMPQAAEHNTVSWDIHRENVRQMLKIFSKGYGKILVSLHPKSKIEDYTEFKKDYEYAILDEQLRNVISGCDVYICNAASTTVNWSQIVGCSRITIQNEWLLKKMTAANLKYIEDEMNKTFDDNKKVNKLVECEHRDIIETIIAIIKKEL